MRSDMFKVITDRPRQRSEHSNVGSRALRTLRNRYRAAKHFTLDGENEVYDEYCCTKLPMKHRRLGWHRKQFNDNLSPLCRYLNAQVGRSWNDVYSEISANLRPNSTVKKHVRDHVFDIVLIKTYRGADNRVWHREFGAYRCDGDGKLYVEPETGILRAGAHAGSREVKGQHTVF